jgi:hypothetical protein
LNSDRPGRPEGPASFEFVNSSLSAFTAVVREVSRGFPFYPDDATDDEIKAAVSRISGVIGEIDGR